MVGASVIKNCCETQCQSNQNLQFWQHQVQLIMVSQMLQIMEIFVVNSKLQTLLFKSSLKKCYIAIVVQTISFGLRPNH